ncbi:hypothetical protein COY89_02100 [Candidatus Roizmanbacteria bacterium CG_4_10_14_0_8_um_filter_36_36]|uniref:Metal-dependent hydrolase n=1 Tax=Candidatus Roizmanbacteria bacterium CG_4_8_14_3_um_filter_36_10 TaxID=1974834 RepID=A0A2M8GML3_9BACT|nr:MAG: hypothetical protein COY89_02100 [Candidatus Roizmanbacteria bacterium CG_4_10_14_0_8_um_filter_36_36]PJA52511.1 MAG: hypothetical protein CO166_05630 [Candidatus Roizmanbacteria bacterium CG_4_9_14_3_um_filter_36_11]PJC81768.1 MAG: hypothetical protein CO007_03095 [Candidatus Roizmanbacteria bacterium CG_4_8_14_3_um_filter_36_10]
MPDLVTHALFVYPAKKWFPKNTIFILIGALLPDLLGRSLGVFNFNLSLIYWYQLAIHTPFCLILFTYSLSFFFREKERKIVFLFILIGAFSHFLLDFFQKTIIIGNLWFFPFSFVSPQLQLFWPDDSIYLIPVLIISNLIFAVISSNFKTRIKNPQ